MACLVEIRRGSPYPRWMMEGWVIRVKAQLPSCVSHIVCINFVLHLPSMSAKYKKHMFKGLSPSQRKCVRMNLRHGGNGNFPFYEIITIMTMSWEDSLTFLCPK